MIHEKSRYYANSTINIWKSEGKERGAGGRQVPTRYFKSRLFSALSTLVRHVPILLLFPSLLRFFDFFPSSENIDGISSKRENYSLFIFQKTSYSSVCSFMLEINSVARARVLHFGRAENSNSGVCLSQYIYAEGRTCVYINIG